MNIRNVLFAPLLSEGKVAGLLGLANKAGDFTERDALMASAFGELAAIALRNNRTLEALTKNENALKQERDFSDNLIETAQVIVRVLDVEGRILRINSYAEQILGYRLGEVRGKDWFHTFVPEGDRARTERIFSESMGGIQTHGNINPVVARDGHQREIEWHDKPIKDPEGRSIWLLCIGLDVTERIRAEVALREHLHFLQTLWE